MSPRTKKPVYKRNFIFREDLYMAKRNYSDNGNNKYQGRRIFLGIAFVVVMGLAIWRLGFCRAVPGIAEDVDILLTDETEPLYKPPVAADVPPDNDLAQPDISEATSESADNPTVETIPAEPANQTPTQAEILLQKGMSALTAGDYITARASLSQAVKLQLPPLQEDEARKLLNQAADVWLFSNNVFPGDKFCQRYKIDDNLAKIGPKFDIPYPLIGRMNNIPDLNKVAFGKTIKIVQGPFHVVVDRKRFLMSVYLGDVLVRTYRVGLGNADRQTPTGLWLVKLKQVNPEWTDPETNKKYLPNDPENPLGERWIAMEGLEGLAKEQTGFGIHGTIEPDKIGQAASRGCIRLHNKDVEELYDMLIENKSTIRVIN